MEKEELIKSLIKSINNLKYHNQDELNAILMRAKMIIRNLLGEDSKYLIDLAEINFVPGKKVIGVGDTHLKENAWKNGQRKAILLLDTILEEMKIKSEAIINHSGEDVFPSRRVFIVHGHDEAMKLNVARALEKLGLMPVILHEQPTLGRTIIEKFTDHSDVGFAIVLLSPDDIGHSRTKRRESVKYRARQNVIFELGFFVGKLGRERVFCLYNDEEPFEIPSDYSGVVYVLYDKPGNWRLNLVKELKICGYDIDADKLL